MREVVRPLLGAVLLLSGVLLLGLVSLRDLSHVSGGRFAERAEVLVPSALACLLLGALLLGA